LRLDPGGRWGTGLRRAASDLRAALAGLNETLEHDFGVTLTIRMGVKTGEVVVGTEERLATGDTSPPGSSNRPRRARSSSAMRRSH
jgi:hypothetical protein